MIPYFCWSVNTFSQENELFYCRTGIIRIVYYGFSGASEKWAICHLYKRRIRVPHVTFCKKFII